jgi:hypothetical protein
MDLVARHRFASTAERVTAALVDPAFAPQLVKVLDVGGVEVIDAGGDESSGWLAVRLTYDGSLDPVAARILGSSNPTWVQTYRVDRSTCTGQLTIEPDHHGSLLTCSAAVNVVDRDDGCERSLRGALSVHVPLIGGRAERALEPAILARIDAEAVLLDDWLNRSP